LFLFFFVFVFFFFFSFLFFFSCSLAHCHLHSFPTRRSSDLASPPFFVTRTAVPSCRPARKSLVIGFGCIICTMFSSSVHFSKGCAAELVPSSGPLPASP